MEVNVYIAALSFLLNLQHRLISRARWKWAGSIGGSDCWLPANETARRKFGRRTVAYTIGRDIYFRSRKYRNDVGYKAHEREHVRQFEREGLGFEARYTAALITHGYEKNPYEIAARKAAARARRKAG